MRLLIKTPPGVKPTAASKATRLEALSQPRPKEQRQQPRPAIYALDVRDGLGHDNPWDAVHEMVERRGRKDSPVQAEFDWIEPDLEHSIFIPPPPREGTKELALFGKKKPLPGGPFGWHLEDAFSQLRKAREEVKFPAAAGSSAPRVRIGHLDTGYDPDHSTAPRRINTQLSRNFIEGGAGARDPGTGRRFVDMPGHGTGTIGILAGSRFKKDAFDGDIGGCPEAEIVPMRISQSVILMWTSSLVSALRHAIDCKCDVLSMSMGGAPSQLWADLVNELYRAGIVFVAAAGNNINGVVTPELVYPARFGRVIAACGVMHNGTPYHDLPGLDMEGNIGPDEVMDHALASFTPNIPWPILGKKNEVDPAGRGTSAATPQIAAAAALYIQKHRAALNALPERWMRVESVRRALFQTARRDLFAQWRKYFGNGVLQAFDALQVAPTANCAMTAPDDAAGGFLKALPGPFGVAEGAAAAMPDPRERYFALELAQRRMMSGAAAAAPRKGHQQQQEHRLGAAEETDRIVEDKAASRALRQFAAGRKRPVQIPAATALPERPGERFRPTLIPPPPVRRLRVFAFDPSLSTRLDRAVANEVELKVRWENGLVPGPCGDYVDVIDHDPASQCFYEPVDLNDRNVVAQSGLTPSEGNPQFHQQMVYGVTMRTVEHFERALGRPVFWATPKGANPKRPFNPRLRVYPHALREANAYYSPDRAALLFGYFPADLGAAGGMVFTCLSHDVVAHEATHAILDGMHRRFQLPTNPDMLAFHEAFADIVALFSRFSLPGVLELEIAQTRGDLEQESTLGQLAQQFGAALGERGALRSAIGGRNEAGRWVRLKPDPTRYQKEMEPHLRGSILLSAIFDVFLAIYKKRTADLIRIATEGTGVLRAGAIHPDLVARLAAEAARTARQILNICIRALDYCPPVDLSFGEYLRALITADFDLVPDDQTGFRVAFVESFRNWGIYPNDVRSLSVESLLWSTTYEGNMQLATPAGHALLDLLREFHQSWSGISPQQSSDTPALAYREKIFELSRKHAAALHEELLRIFGQAPGLAEEVGLDSKIRGRGGKARAQRMIFEVHSVRIAERHRPDGSMLRQVIVTLTQGRDVRLDSGEMFKFHGGSTIIVDLNAPEHQMRYAIRKNITSQSREDRTRKYLQQRRGSFGLRAVYFGDGLQTPGEPFALLHRHSDLGEVY